MIRGEHIQIIVHGVFQKMQSLWKYKMKTNVHLQKGKIFDFAMKPS